MATLKRLISLLYLLALCTTGFTFAQSHKDLNLYTEEHPLVYEDAWDLWPYAFLDDEGEPAGFNIDLTKAIMHRLKIPYIIRLKHSKDAYDDLKNGKSNLILGMKAAYHDSIARYGNNVVCLFTHSILSPKRNPTRITRVDQLGQERLIVHKNSFSHNLMIKRGAKNLAIPYDDMKEAAFRANVSDSDAVLWNTLSLKWLKNHYELNNLKLTPVAMPHGEYHFMSNDSLLLATVDSVYNEMVINDEIQPLKNKWFYPEYKESGIPLWIWNLLIVLTLLLVVIISFNIVYRYRARKAKALLEKKNKRLQLYLQSGKITLWTYDVKTTTFTTISNGATEIATYDSMGLPSFYNEKIFKRIDNVISRILKGETDTDTFILEGVVDQQTRFYKLNISVLRSANGKPAVLLGTQRDITAEHIRKQNNQKKLSMLFNLFNTAMVDMAYFDKDGYLLEMNDRAIKTLQIKSRETAARAHLHINKIAPLTGINLNQREVQFSSSITDLTKLQQEGKLSITGRTGMMYYQSALIPILDKQGNIDCYICVGSDITDMVQSIQQEKRLSKMIEDATKNIQDYVDNINYVLDESDINVAYYYPDKKELVVMPNMREEPFVLTQLRALRLLHRNEWFKAIKAFEAMDKREDRSIVISLETILKDEGKRTQFMSFTAIPIYNKEKKVDHYFGLCRNISEMKETELLLEKESKKALEAETIKNAFLKNMSHEIRTPLNAVIGFAELFDSEHAPEDESIFIEEIKKNTNILLNLINDILFLSRLDAKMVEYKKEFIDFVPLFNASLQMGWSKYLKPDVEIGISCTYDSMIVDIDTDSVGRVITHLAANAAHYTETGSIKANAYYHATCLYFTIEDTGCGMSKEQLEHVFDRFTFNSTSERRGSGLGLNICKELVEQMGGQIDVQSHEGAGTTVWVSLPCTLQSFTSKKGKKNNNTSNENNGNNGNNSNNGNNGSDSQGPTHEALLNDPQLREQLLNDPQLQEQLLNDPQLQEQLLNDPQLQSILLNDPKNNLFLS